MSVLITGASGFIGSSLASALLGENGIQQLSLTDLTKPPVPEARQLTSTSFARVTQSDTKVNLIGADLTKQEDIDALLDSVLKDCEVKLSLVYILHGLMSGDSEANHASSVEINLNATINLLTTLKQRCPGVRVVYASSCAVFGPQDQDSQGQKTKTVSESTYPLPTGTYGTHKAMMELFIQDLSRRQEIEARIVRLPTVIVRAGKPSGAASSFASAMFREPLQGVKSVLPVRRDLEIWICSARTVTRNLILAGKIDEQAFVGMDDSRIVLLPGKLVMVQDMIDALGTVGGADAVALLEEKIDDSVVKIVEGWVTRISDARARSLVFVEDGSLEETVREFVEDYLGGPEK